MDTSGVTLPRRSFVGVLVSALAGCAGWTRRESAPATIGPATYGPWQAQSLTGDRDAAFNALRAEMRRINAAMARDIRREIYRNPIGPNYSHKGTR